MSTAGDLRSALADTALLVVNDELDRLWEEYRTARPGPAGFPDHGPHHAAVVPS